MNKIEYIDNNIGTTSEEFYNKASKLLRAMTGKDLVDYVSYDTWIKPFREVCSVTEKGGILISRAMEYVERTGDYTISLIATNNIIYQYFETPFQNDDDNRLWYRFEFLNKKGE